MPTRADTARLIARLYLVADNLIVNRRETPQRFIPLAAVASRDADIRLRLVRFLHPDALVVLEQGVTSSSRVLNLLRRIAYAVINERMIHP